MHERESAGVLSKLSEIFPRTPELEYFYELALRHLDTGTLPARSVAIMGCGFPESLVYAAGLVPYWIPGGSTAAAALASETLPRDADPVSRSMFGALTDGGFPGEIPTIIPIACDSHRKIAYTLKRMGRNVLTLDTPFARNQSALREWARQKERCMEAVARYAGKRVTQESLESARKLVEAARTQARRFDKLCRMKADMLPGAFRLFLLNSYYFTDDLTRWTANLARLCAALRAYTGHAARRMRPRVLLIGSPVCFPNFKLPLMLEEAGLTLYSSIDCYTRHLLGGEDSIFDGQVRNDALWREAGRLTREGAVDGIVCHVLKGQIEYDFELMRMEDTLTRHDIPVIRLETDYHEQDVEQLRIRLDAFGEMLLNRRYSRMGAAV